MEVTLYILNEESYNQNLLKGLFKIVLNKECFIVIEHYMLICGYNESIYKRCYDLDINEFVQDVPIHIEVAFCNSLFADRTNFSYRESTVISSSINENNLRFECDHCDVLCINKTMWGLVKKLPVKSSIKFCTPNDFLKIFEEVIGSSFTSIFISPVQKSATKK